jgi:hypothetical protein
MIERCSGCGAFMTEEDDYCLDGGFVEGSYFVCRNPRHPAPLSTERTDQ